ncbi:DgyrCDS3206 [Dimorphilus gyrociliatus]|uniref:DgyrCDS3206 n=1 Tax=Dimorphilus gyrociliatus TaxID=2664684 RepID=A0A7I8VEE3_9ANNE|nr:DgyrCDS3206 [Dimorphilus gyrociliatus]
MKCLPNEKFCDSIINCEDKSDEICKTSSTNPDLKICQKNSYHCDKNRCIPREFYCNTRYDCKDNSDEENEFCDTAKEFKACALFIKESKNACNLQIGLEDEILSQIQGPYYHLNDCENHICLNGTYGCQDSGYCIPVSLICDGITHCTKGDDEIDCGYYFLLYNRKIYMQYVHIRSISAERFLPMSRRQYTFKARQRL